MKTNIFTKGFMLIICFAIINIVSVSQNCSKQSLCKPDKNDGYDYSSQSRYASLTTGEKSRLYITTYINCAYRISVCSEQNLGQIHFKLFEKVREKKKVIKEIVKEDASDNQPDGETSVVDTVFENQILIKEVEIFDSSKGNSVWQINKVDKTKNLVLEIYIPKTEEPTNGCVNLLVGTKRPVKSNIGKLKDIN